MVPVLVAAVIGATIGALGRPHGRHLATPVLVLPSVAIAGAGIQVLLGWFDLPGEGNLFAWSLALLTGFAVVNRHLVGMGVLAAGLSMNFTAVVLHGAMPVRPSAVVAAGIAGPGHLADVDLGAGRRFERTGDLAPWLGDVIPLETFGSVVSFGDLVAAMGVAVIAAELARYARRGQRWSLVTWLAESSARRLAPEVVVEVGVDREQARVIDVREDVEELDRADDVVDAEDRVLR